jgi:predicted transposase/invertase (TIGR01784 family)
MQTDDLLFRIFQSFPSLVFQLMGDSGTDPSGYSFKSIQVKQTKLTMDGLFSPPDDRPEDPLYFIETQFQPDPDLYYRLMGEIHLYLRQYKPARRWQAVVFFPRASVDAGIPVEYQALDHLLIQRIYLDSLRQETELPPALGLIRLVIEPVNAAEEQARQLITQTRQQIQDPITLSRILELIQTTLVYKFPTKSRTEIEAMFGLSELKQTKVYQEAVQEGMQGEAFNLVTRMLGQQIGTLPPEIQQQLETLSTDQLEALAIALLKFRTPADLIQWLRQNPNK